MHEIKYILSILSYYHVNCVRISLFVFTNFCTILCTCIDIVVVEINQLSFKVTEPICEDDLQSQLQKMITRLTTSIYKMVSVALFAHHQLTFSFMLCTCIMRSNTHVNESLCPSGGAAGGADTISQLEWHLFLQGNIMAGMLDEETCKKHDGGCEVCEWVGCGTALWNTPIPQVHNIE